MVTRKQIPSCAALAAAVLLSAAPAPAFGAAITFAPAGAQLDGDAILDHVPGGQITFEISINTAGLPSNLVGISYDILYDPSELDPVGLALDVGGVFPFSAGSLNVNPGIGAVRHGGGALAPGFNAVVDTATFDTLELRNDGAIDFSVTVTNALADSGFGAVVEVTNLFMPRFQDVEVQPIPEPGSFALLASGGLALLWRGWRRQRRTIA